MYEDLKARIKKHEGFLAKVYLDSLGKATIGYGHLLTDPARQIWNSFNNRANTGGADAPEAAVNGCLYDRFKSLYTKTATKPSLVIVPARFKSGTLYSQIPSSNADFTVTRPLNTATRFDSSALIQTGITSGIPRLDYYTSGGVTGCPALLVEPAATNLAFHSEIWASGNNWTLDAVTRVTGSTSAFLAPDGTFTANALSPTSANVFHGLYSNSSTQNTYISGTIYTQSAFFKQGTGVAGRYVQLTYTGGGQFTQNGYANFDLQLGTVAVVSGTSADTNRAARIENYGNGWYRCSFTATCNAAGNGIGVLPVLVNASGNTRAQSFAGVTGDILYGWGAQLETGSVATSYIPTTTGTGSRSADVVSVSGAVSGSIGQTEGAIYVEFEHTSNTAERRLIALSDGTATNRIFIWALSNILYAQIQGNSTIISNSIPSGYNKVAFAYQQNGVSGNLSSSINGGAVVSGTSTTYPSTLSRVALGNTENVGGTFQWNNRIRAAALYPTRLTNAQLSELTSTSSGFFGI